MTMYQNPVTFGVTPVVDAFRIALCPTCASPAVSAVDEPADEGRLVRYGDRRGHVWRTSWSGQTETIRRRPKP